MAKPKLMRDAFIDEVIAAARRDPNLYFLSADFGAAALDSFRRDLPDQFLHTGICEQNMIDVAAGLALAGKTVFVYAMAPFITARCYEQTKSVLASMNLPVTLVAVGVGLGYDHATLTHFTPEDVACMRALNRIEIWSPADAEAAAALGRDAAARPAFRYVRLERQGMAEFYQGRFEEARARGLIEIKTGSDVAIVSCGYLSHKALAAAEALAAEGVSAGVIDVFRLKPNPAEALIDILGRYRAVVTVEEQMLEGGFGSLVLEAMADGGRALPLRRLGIRDGFEVVNGDRDHLHRLYGIDTPHIIAAARDLQRGAKAA